MTSGAGDAGIVTAVLPWQVLIATSCWSCGLRLVKAVRRLAGARPVRWSCDRCEVAWTEHRSAPAPGNG